jgi:hypothetical protein
MMGACLTVVDKLGEILNKLEAIDISVLRALGGLPYAGQLDQYLL